MDNILQAVQTGIILLIIIAFVIYFLAEIFYCGKKKQITVLEKRETTYQGFNSTRSKQTYVKHYTVDCHYSSSEKIHTLRCSQMIFDSLKQGKTYTVTIKMREIIKLWK